LKEKVTNVPCEAGNFIAKIFCRKDTSLLFWQNNVAVVKMGFQ